jgi:hypothetical protein
MIEAGVRVAVSIDSRGDATGLPAIIGREGLVERLDGAVCWVRLDGDQQAMPFLIGCLTLL